MDPAADDTQALEAIQDPAAAPSAQPEGRACANCGAPLADGQDWCLECGTASQRSRSPLPGWRTGAATVVAAVVLASGAAAAAYAAITSDDGSSSGTQIAGVLSPGGDQATDPVPQPDPIDIPSEQEVPPLNGAAQAPDASASVPPPVTPPAGQAPVAPATPAVPYTPPPYTPPPYTPPPYTPPPAAPVTPPSTPSTPSTSGGGGGSGSSSSGGSGKAQGSGPVERRPLVEVKLDPKTTVAASYNPPLNAGAATKPTQTTTTPTTTTPTQTTTTPAQTTTTTTPAQTTTTPAQTTTTPTTPAQTTTTPAAPAGDRAHAASDFSGDPTAAFDGDPATAWSVALPTPQLVAEPQAGLLINLPKATTLRKLVITPTTPGTTIEVYGSNAGTAPATVGAKGWKKLATQLEVDGKTKITLGKDTVGTGKLRHLLIWFAAGPDDGTSKSVGISELQLYR